MRVYTATAEVYVLYMISEFPCIRNTNVSATDVPNSHGLCWDLEYQ